jgi:hypothetical protein
MSSTTRDIAQVETAFDRDFAFERDCVDTEPQRADRRKPPARYEAAAIVIMLLIVAFMPLFAG